MNLQIIEDYRRTLDALKGLLKKKEKERANQKEIDVIREEIREVTDVITHLTKGVNRYRWTD